jgi:hypothetical protein
MPDMTDAQAAKADAATNVVAFPTPTPAPANPWYRPPMRDVLAVISTALISIAFLAPLFRSSTAAPLDPDLKGAVLIQWGFVMGYYFGTSKTSVAKDRVVADLASQAAA